MLKGMTMAIGLALFGFASASTTAGAAEATRISAQPYQVAAWNDRICCKRGWQDWRTTRRACNRAGGHQVRDRQCRDDWNDSWDMRWFGWTGGNWNSRVCCKRGGRDWFTSARECREAGGWQVAKRQCRNG